MTYREAEKMQELARQAFGFVEDDISQPAVDLKPHPAQGFASVFAGMLPGTRPITAARD